MSVSFLAQCTSSIQTSKDSEIFRDRSFLTSRTATVPDDDGVVVRSMQVGGSPIHDETVA
jgi:hypothetical protein